MMRDIFKSILLTGILIMMMNSIAQAEPSSTMREFMKTPASAFDLFLFRLEDSMKCYQTYWGNPGDSKLDMCLTTLSYNFEDNIIDIHFFVGGNHKTFKSISGKPEKEKEKIIKSLLLEVSQIIGLEKKEFGNLGQIQKIPIRHGYTTQDFDESKIREEIIKRTKVTLHFSKVDGKCFLAQRSHHGEITITEIGFCYESKNSS
jgi:hypothetical protein